MLSFYFSFTPLQLLTLIKKVTPKEAAFLQVYPFLVVQCAQFFNVYEKPSTKDGTKPSAKGASLLFT